MKNWINKFLCGLLHHRIPSEKAKLEYDKQTQRCTVTETCERCGKKNIFAFRKEK